MSLPGQHSQELFALVVGYGLIVYYADKRVRHNVVVNLDERLEYILDHYGKGTPDRRELIRKNFNKCLALEQHLFHWLPFGPKELGRF